MEGVRPDQPPRRDLDEGSSFALHLRAQVGARCLYCRDAFDGGQRLLTCEGCQAVYHPECLRQELGRCATLGCSATRAWPRRVAAAPAEEARRLARAFGRELVLSPSEEELVRGAFGRRLEDRERPLLLLRGDDGLVLGTDRALHVGRGRAPERLAYAEVRAARVEEGRALVVERLEGPGVRLPPLEPASTVALRRFLEEVGAEPPVVAPPAACAWCVEPFAQPQGPFATVERVLECEGCRRAFHRGCLVWLTRCPTGGCDGARAHPRSPPAAPAGAPPEPAEPAPTPDLSACAACRTELPVGARAFACEGCGALFHRRCLSALGTCPAYRCGGLRAVPRVVTGPGGATAHPDRKRSLAGVGALLLGLALTGLGVVVLNRATPLLVGAGLTLVVVAFGVFIAASEGTSHPRAGGYEEPD